MGDGEGARARTHTHTDTSECAHAHECRQRRMKRQHRPATKVGSSVYTSCCLESPHARSHLKRASTKPRWLDKSDALGAGGVSRPGSLGYHLGTTEAPGERVRTVHGPNRRGPPAKQRSTRLSSIVVVVAAAAAGLCRRLADTHRRRRRNTRGHAFHKGPRIGWSLVESTG